MFGNFMQNFGLPDMPQQDMMGGAGSALQPQAAGPIASPASPLAPPAAGAPPGGGMAQSQSPLGLGSLGLGAAPQPGAIPENPMAPAAGIGSPFQKLGMGNG